MKLMYLRLKKIPINVSLSFHLNLFSTRTFQGQTPSMQILNPNLFSLLMDQIKNVKHDIQAIKVY